MQSGAHFNPAATLTFYRLGKVRRRDALGYIGAQFAGAAAGVGVALGGARLPSGRPGDALRGDGPGPDRGGRRRFSPKSSSRSCSCRSILRVSNHRTPGPLHGPLRRRPGGALHHRRGAALRHEHESGADPRARAVWRAATGPPSGSTSSPRRSGCWRPPSCISGSGGAGPCSAPSCITRTRSAASSASTPAAPRAEPFRASRHYSPHDTIALALPLTLEGE